MKPRMSQRIQFSLAYLLVAVIVLSFLQSWLLAPRTGGEWRGRRAVPSPPPGRWSR